MAQTFRPVSASHSHTEEVLRPQGFHIEAVRHGVMQSLLVVRTAEAIGSTWLPAAGVVRGADPCRLLPGET